MGIVIIVFYSIYICREFAIYLSIYLVYENTKTLKNYITKLQN